MIWRRFIKKSIKYMQHPFKMRRFHVLEELIKNNKFTSFAEIGVWDGDTTRHLIKTCELDKVICVDDYKDNNGGYENERVKQAFRNIADLRMVPEVTFIFKRSIEAASLVPDKSLDIIFIDANHTYEDLLDDLDAWLPKLKDTGIMAGHDYQVKYLGVIHAVMDTFFPIKVKEDNVWWAWKRNVKN